uniref:Uncharacterized protein n=1 Tax=Oryza glumipatula TaxID=40148 RepID=A0A0E0BDM5_9ORYZ
MADLVRRHGLQVDGRRRRVDVEVHRPVLRRVEVEPPVLWGEGVAEDAERPVERHAVAVVAGVEAHLDVGRLVVVRLDEAHGDRPRPPRERALEHGTHGGRRQVADGGRRRDGVGQHDRRVRPRPPRLALEEREPADHAALRPRRERDGHGALHIIVPDAAARRHDLIERGVIEPAGDRQAEPRLVPPHGDLEVLVEGVRRVTPRLRHVPEPRQVPLQLREPRDMAPSPRVEQLLERVPRHAAVPVHHGEPEHHHHRHGGDQARRGSRAAT